MFGIGRRDSSILIMPPGDAVELETRLRGLGVRVATGAVSIGRSTLEAFRRPAALPA